MELYDIRNNVYRNETERVIALYAVHDRVLSKGAFEWLFSFQCKKSLEPQNVKMLIEHGMYDLLGEYIAKGVELEFPNDSWESKQVNLSSFAVRRCHYDMLLKLVRMYGLSHKRLNLLSLAQCMDFGSSKMFLDTGWFWSVESPLVTRYFQLMPRDRDLLVTKESFGVILGVAVHSKDFRMIDRLIAHPLNSAIIMARAFLSCCDQIKAGSFKETIFHKFVDAGMDPKDACTVNEALKVRNYDIANIHIDAGVVVPCFTDIKLKTNKCHTCGYASPVTKPCLCAKTGVRRSYW